MDNKTLLRIAKALEELIALVKEDMRPRKKKPQSWPTGLGKAENCIGGFTFQWSDGWWKTGQTNNLDKHDSTASWSNGGYRYDFVKGQNNMNEEWFGVTSKRPTNTDRTYSVNPRAAFYLLQEVHKINPYKKNRTPENLIDEFSKIKLNEASEKAKLNPR